MKTKMIIQTLTICDEDIDKLNERVNSELRFLQENDHKIIDIKSSMAAIPNTSEKYGAIFWSACIIFEDEIAD